MNLPLSNLKRDELYTFIVGIFTATAWYLYFQELGTIERRKDIIDPALVFAWLLSTGAIFIFYMILLSALDMSCQRKIQTQNDDIELAKMKLTKNKSFFWAGPLEEQKLLQHILGLITVSLIFVFHPIVSFIVGMQLGLSWLGVICVVYLAVTIAAYLMLSKTSHYLHQVKNFLDKDYCDTLDQETYIRERAVDYARLKNTIFRAYLTHDAQPPAPETGNELA